MNKKIYFSPKLNIDKINFDDILAASNIEIKDNLDIYDDSYIDL